jgi:serine/threonine protein kinase
MKRVVGERTGTMYPLHPSAILGQGVEASVYSSNGRALKVLANPISPRRVERTRFFMQKARKLPGFVWPIELALDPLSKEVVGEVQVAIAGETLEHILDQRLPADPLNFSVRQKVQQCLAVSRAVEEAHKLKSPEIVLRDVLKAGNLIIAGSQATFIDATSASLLGFRSVAGTVVDSIEFLGTPGYLPKEVLENPRVRPAHSDDLFSLAVLLFEMLFGRLPTDCPNAIGLDPDEAVRTGIYPRYLADPDYAAPAYEDVNPPAEIDWLFRTAFLTTNRPTARRWVETLEAWEAHLSPPAGTWLDRLASRGVAGAVLVCFLTVVGLARHFNDRPVPESVPAAGRQEPRPESKDETERTKPRPRQSDPSPAPGPPVGTPFFKEFFR